MQCFLRKFQGTEHFVRDREIFEIEGSRDRESPLYCKNFLLLKIIDIKYLQECINFEMKIREKLCNFIVLYRSPSQS